MSTKACEYNCNKVKQFIVTKRSNFRAKDLQVLSYYYILVALLYSLNPILCGFGLNSTHSTVLSLYFFSTTRYVSFACCPVCLTPFLCVVLSMDILYFLRTCNTMCETGLSFQQLERCIASSEAQTPSSIDHLCSHLLFLRYILK